MTDPVQLDSSAQNTWCPGCGNFGILTAVKGLVVALEEEGIARERIVLVSGIGCHAKIVDYLQLNTFYAIHGRTVPVATGIKLANPELTVIAHMGDGDGYGEGLEHLLFAAKRNVDITAVVHNNGVYALTTGQTSPTSRLGFPGRSTPGGNAERPMNPLELALAAGATFVARDYSRGADRLKGTLRRAVLHRGFSLVDVLQVCMTFNNLYQYYNERVAELEEHNEESRTDAQARMTEWTYGGDGRIALGVFYRDERTETFDGHVVRKPVGVGEREAAIAKILARRV